MSKWLPTIIAIAGGIFSLFSPTLQSGVSHHPEISAVLAAVYAILAHLLPSPVQPAKR